MALQEWIKNGEARLANGPHPDRAHADAELLLLHLLERDRVFLIAHAEENLSAEGVARYHALIDRRLSGEPIQYIVGEVEFYGLPFRVTRDVLIPRHETELLVEKVLERIQSYSSRKPVRIVDVGTGSGAIAVALACKLGPAAQVEITATDISAAALELARKNAELNGVADRIRFLYGDLLEPVAEERFDFIVSNPPYVPIGDRESLDMEVREFEPALALFAGVDGLAVYRRLIPDALKVLNPHGMLALEIGFGQRDGAGALLYETGFGQVEFFHDLQLIQRVALAQRRWEMGPPHEIGPGVYCGVYRPV